MQLPVYHADGTQAGVMQAVSDSVFGVEPNEHAMYEAVVAQQRRARHGTHSTKTRAEVSGANRKLYRQKGTGNARAGMLRSPIRVGGGRVFGPKPHPYHYHLPKKVKTLARYSALTCRARENAVYVVEDFSLEAPRTRRMAEFFRALGVAAQRVLFVTTDPSEVLVKSCRNLPHVVVRHGNAFSTLDILGCQRIVFQQGALGKIGATEA